LEEVRRRLGEAGFERNQDLLGLSPRVGVTLREDRADQRSDTRARPPKK